MESKIPFSLVFLSGGQGMRMGYAIPKQYLILNEKILALYSFEVFLSLSELQEVVVVCEEQYEELYRQAFHSKEGRLLFARPGPRRQDSVFNGIQQLRGNPLVCIHDSARPFIEPQAIRHVIQEADSWEAAILGVKVKSTIKVCDGAQVVVETPNRVSLWEIQTPQVIRLQLLLEGFAHAKEHDLCVTDDASLIEQLGKPVKIVEGSYHNIKITTSEDLAFAEQLIKKYELLQTHSPI